MRPTIIAPGSIASILSAASVVCHRPFFSLVLDFMLVHLLSLAPVVYLRFCFARPPGWIGIAFQKSILRIQMKFLFCR